MRVAQGRTVAVELASGMTVAVCRLVDGSEGNGREVLWPCEHARERVNEVYGNGVMCVLLSFIYMVISLLNVMYLRNYQQTILFLHQSRHTIWCVWCEQIEIVYGRNRYSPPQEDSFLNKTNRSGLCVCIFSSQQNEKGEKRSSIDFCFSLFFPSFAFCFLEFYGESRAFFLVSFGVF